jgi:alginate O-acetyltransferase complex protein AlgJ
MLSRRAMLAALPAATLAAAGSGAMAAEIVNGVIIGRDGWLFAIYDALREARPPLYRRVLGVFGDAVRTLKAGGIETALVLLPARSRVYEDMLPADLVVQAEARARYPTMVQDFGQAGALVPDLAAAMLLARKANPTTLLSMRGDTHWTGEGAAVAATEMARQIQARFKLPASPRPGVQLGAPVETDQSYDLVRLLPAQRRGQYPDQTYFVRQPVQSGGLVAEDEAADVAVVGNSYMQPRYGFANLLSNQLNRPVSLTWDVNTVGPYAMMLRYLGSAAFKQQRPKLVVWTLQELDVDVPPERPDVWGQNAMKPEVFQAEIKRLLALG